MATDNALLANEVPTRGKRENFRSVYSWVLGAFLGAVLTFVLLGALVSLSTGLGLLQLIGLLRGGRTLIKVDQPAVVRQNSTTPTTGNCELHHGQDYFG